MLQKLFVGVNPAIWAFFLVLALYLCFNQAIDWRLKQWVRSQGFEGPILALVVAVAFVALAGVAGNIVGWDATQQH